MRSCAPGKPRSLQSQMLVRVDGKKWLSAMLILPFFWRQPGATAGCSEAAQQQPCGFSNDDIKVIMHYVFVWAAYFLSVEKKWHIIKQNTYIIKQDTKSTETARSSSNGRSRLQRIITLYYLFERSADNYVPFWRGTGFCQTHVTGHQAEGLK